MRYAVGFVLGLSLVALTVRVSAQRTDKSGAEELYRELAREESTQAPPPEPVPSEAVPSEPASEGTAEQPPLELKLDATGLELAPSPRRTLEGYTPADAELRVRRVRTGLYASAGVYVLGLALAISGAAGDCNNLFIEYLPDRCQPLLYTGSTLQILGVVGMITSGVMLARRKRDRSSLRRAWYRTPRWVRLDLARSRLVF